MLKEFRKYISQENLFIKEDRILLALSGGIDSIAMTELFVKAKFNFGLVHCNFQLRAEESDADEVFVRNLANKLKVPFYSRRFFTIDYADLHRLSIQMAARELRYKWFHEILEKEKFDFIATAHHLDDQVETFLINMMRSSGIAGFHGILPKMGKIIRPLLFTSRKEIEIFVNKHQLKYREDSSNKETKYLRNKIRHEVLPAFADINPDFKKILNENIFRVREAEMIFRESIEFERIRIVIKEKDKILLSINNLIKLEPVTTYLHEFLSPYGFNFSVVSNLIQALDEDPGKQFFSSTHRLIKDRENLIITPIQSDTDKNIAETEYLIDQTISQIEEPINLAFQIIEKNHHFKVDTSASTANLDFNKIIYPLKLRKWLKGDHFYPFGRDHKKKLSDFFTDKKFSLADKENTWLLCSEDKIVWIVGHRIDNRFRITPKTKEVLQIIVTI